jgi:hypothetical protein
MRTFLSHLDAKALSRGSGLGKTDSDPGIGLRPRDRSRGPCGCVRLLHRALAIPSRVYGCQTGRANHPECWRLTRPCSLQDVFPKVFLPNPPGWSYATPFGVVCPASARGTLHRSSPCVGARPNVLPCSADRSGTPQMRRVLQRGALADSGGGAAGGGQCKIPFVCPDLAGGDSPQAADTASCRLCACHGHCPDGSHSKTECTKGH